MKYKIDIHTPTNPVIEIEHEGYRIIGFSIQHLEPDRWEWLGEVLTRQCTELIERIERNATKKVQDQIKLALAL